MGYNSYQIGCLIVEYGLSNTTLIRNLIYIRFGIILTQFYINFSRQKHQQKCLFCIVQDLWFSGFILYPLSFFLYSPFKNTDYSSKYINMNTSLKKTSFVIFKKNSFLNKSKNLQFFSNLLQVISILPLFFHSFQTSQNKSEATWIYICSASIHKYTYLSLYFRGVYYPPPFWKPFLSTDVI